MEIAFRCKELEDFSMLHAKHANVIIANTGDRTITNKYNDFKATKKIVKAETCNNICFVFKKKKRKRLTDVKKNGESEKKIKD